MRWLARTDDHCSSGPRKSFASDSERAGSGRLGMMSAADMGSGSRMLARAGAVSMALFLALFLGLASVFLPAWFVVSTMLVPAVLVLMLVRPEYALLAAVALVCDLVHPALVPRVPLLGGSISAADAALAMLTAYATWVFVAGAGKTRLAPIPGGRWLLVPGSFWPMSQPAILIRKPVTQSWTCCLICKKTARPLLSLSPMTKNWQSGAAA